MSKLELEIAGDLHAEQARVLRRVLAAAAGHGLDPVIAKELIAIMSSTQRLLGLLSTLSGPIGVLIRRLIAVRGRSPAAAVQLILAPRLLARAIETLEEEAEDELRVIRDRDAAEASGRQRESSLTCQRLIEDLDRVRGYAKTSDLRARNTLLTALAAVALLMSRTRTHAQVPVLLAALVI